MKLYDYWRSSSSYRLRIALALKGIDADERAFVHLVRNGGEQRGEAYRAVNPQGRVPSVMLASSEVLVQSPAIIEWLEETRPEPALLPVDLVRRAQVRAVAAIIGCDMHPLHNAAPLNYLRQTFGADDAAVNAWVGRWIADGFGAVEALIGDEGFCFGAMPGLADVYLVPQVFAARRFKVSLDAYPRIRRADALATAHPAFKAAHPDAQPDAERPA